MKAIKLLFIFLVFAGCKTVKEQNQTKVKESVLVSNDIRVNTDSSTVASGREVSNSVVTCADSTVTKITEILLSKPDSAGNQFPERIIQTETTKVHNSQKQTNHARDSTNRTIVANSLIDKSDFKSETDIQTETKTIEKFKTPKYIIGMVTILIVIVLFVLRRFKLLKGLGLNM